MSVFSAAGRPFKDRFYRIDFTVDATTRSVNAALVEAAEPTPEQPDPGETIPDVESDPVPEPAPDPEEE